MLFLGCIQWFRNRQLIKKARKIEEQDRRLIKERDRKCLIEKQTAVRVMIQEQCNRLVEEQICALVMIKRQVSRLIAEQHRMGARNQEQVRRLMEEETEEETRMGVMMQEEFRGLLEEQTRMLIMIQEQIRTGPLKQNYKLIEGREAKRRRQLEERNHQQAQKVLLIFNKMQQTMDPLIAARAYNIRFCPLISKFPEELLLCILDFLRDDPVTLHCLRAVCSIFFRLLHHQSGFWNDAYHHHQSHYWNALYLCHEKYSGNDAIGRAAYLDKGNALNLRPDLKRQLRRLLQRDGRCDNCRYWNEALRLLHFDLCKFEHSRIAEGPCMGTRKAKLNCYGCHDHHNIDEFSLADQDAKEQTRLCLGRQGTVELCEHVQIAWAEIEAHVQLFWRQGRERGWQDWLNEFRVECKHDSHDTRCTSSEAPTWPRARLRPCSLGSKIVLSLEWEPHRRMDMLTLTTGRRIPAAELRLLFQNLRQLGPADILCPPYHSGTLPEMICFSQSSSIRPFIYYKTENEEENEETSPTPLSPFPSSLRLSWLHSDRFHGNSKALTIRSHGLRDVSRTDILQQCLKVSYRKDIMICETEVMKHPGMSISPSHHWLHAMDTRTYPHPLGDLIMPLCTNESCTNYCRRPKVFHDCPDHVLWLMNKRRSTE